MKGLIFIRHAETDLAGTFCGHTDPPINALGHAQVKDLIARLANEPFDTIYCSDLRRATETAQALAQAFAVPCTTTSRLREIHFGAWEGMTWTEIEHSDPDNARRWVESFPNVSAPEGESYEAFKGRVLEQVGHLLDIAIDQRIAVVTHAGVMRVVLQALLGHSEQQAWDITRPYCSFFVFTDRNMLQEAKP